MLAIIGTTWLFTAIYFKVTGFMKDQTIGDPNDPNNPYRNITVDEFNRQLKEKGIL